MLDVIICGAGPSGLACAVYAASEGLKTLVIGSHIGGQAAHSSRIENYLGFPTGVSGFDLAQRATAQALKFGASIIVDDIVTLHNDDCLHVETSTIDVPAKSIVLATGAEYTRLATLNAYPFVHYAATHIEAKLCVDEEIIVIGAGNSAGQAINFLAHIADHVHVLVRHTMAESMSDYLVQRIRMLPNATVYEHSELVDAQPGRVTWTTDGAFCIRPVKHVFSMTGAKPRTDWLHNITLDEKGFILTDASFHTSLPGVFAIGDVRSGSIKRVATAIGEGASCVSSIHQSLSKR